jgi:hypothetical protein
MWQIKRKIMVSEEFYTIYCYATFFGFTAS